MKFVLLILGLAAAVTAEELDYEEVFSKASNKFSLNLLSKAVEQNKGSNVVISGFSALEPLGQLSQAAIGESHDEILNVIGFPNDNITKSAFYHTNHNVRLAKGVNLNVANSLYVQKHYELNNNFAALSKDVFNSEVKKADFSKSSETAQDINTWVEDHTNHRIKNLIAPSAITPDVRVVIVNAIAFKGSWAKKFNKKFTTERDFHVSKQETIKLPTMFNTGDYFYGTIPELDSKVLELLFEGGDVTCLIVLPNEIDGIKKLESNLNPEVIDQAVSQMFQNKVDLQIPKFKIETSLDLKSGLQQMGLQKIFSNAEARLDNLLQSPENLYVGSAVQKAFIEVNEEGAEAAAASAYAVLTRSFKQVQTIPFIVDRPFYFELRIQKTVLFSGYYRR